MGNSYTGAMAEEKPLNYAVLLSDPAALLSPKIAEAMARFQKVPIADMGAPARRSWGIIAQGLPKAEGQRLLDHMGALGLGGLVIPENLIEDLPPAQRLDSLEPGGERLSLAPHNAAAASVPWSQVRLAAAAAFKKTTVKTVKVTEGPSSGEKALNVGLMMSGIPIKVGKNKEVLKTLEETDLVLYLDLCIGSPAARYRVDAQNFDYSFLKAKMAYNVFSNFKTMIIDLSERGRFPINRGAAVIFEGKPINSMAYESLADLERETRWLLTLRALKPA